MPLADARAMLPGLETVPADPADDAAALAWLAGWCGRYGPWTSVDATAPGSIAGIGGAVGGDGSIWLDVTGCAHLFGGEAALLADLASRLGRMGLDARAAVADTPGAAWAAARFARANGFNNSDRFQIYGVTRCYSSHLFLHTLVYTVQL